MSLQINLYSRQISHGIFIAGGFGVRGAVLTDAMLASIARVEHLARLQRLQADPTGTRAGRSLARLAVNINK